MLAKVWDRATCKIEHKNVCKTFVEMFLVCLYTSFYGSAGDAADLCEVSLEEYNFSYFIT